MKEQYFIIDFDSTFVQTESLEDLAEIALSSHPQQQSIVEQIRQLTTMGMEGKLPLVESLDKRIALLSANSSHITKTVKKLKRTISPSFLRNKQFLKTYGKNIFIVSGGFKELVIPVVSPLGIPEENVFANTFIFDDNGMIVGIDNANPLCRNSGKAKIVHDLNLDGELFFVGDGITDLEIKKQLQRGTFIAYTENILREKVVKDADIVAKSFDEVLYSQQLPRALSYPKTKMRVLLLENIHPKAVEAFEQEGYTVETYKKSLSKEELLKVIENVHVLGIRSRTQIDAEVLAHAKKLLAIGAFCIGTDQIDLATCKEKGIAVFNAPYSNTRSVVELALGEMIMLSRKIFEKSTALHNGIWDKSASGSYEIRGKTLGIIGYGNIGSQLSVLAESLGMKVIFYDVAEKLSLGNAIQYERMEDVLREADIITVHVDGRPENKRLIDVKAFQQMKDGAIFLNLSRGNIVDVEALVTSIKNGKVAGAGVDVFPHESKSKEDPFISQLQHLPNVILTPHIGGSTKEAQERIARFVSTKLIDFINTGSTVLNLSLPQISLSIAGRGHRLLHMHKNAPGILAKINSILANQHVNIQGQYLKTNSDIGYVITDVNKKYDTHIVELLKDVPETIKLRVLY